MQQALHRQFDFGVALSPIDICVVVPVLNERDNIAELIPRIGAALIGVEWEIMFVDDGSTDGTPELISQIAVQDRRIRLIRRFNRRGLSSAVIEGMLASTAPVVAVIDGDLQHDESLLPHFYRAIMEGGHDIATGTRYAEGGSTGDWTRSRLRISQAATRLATFLTGSKMSDPMSGLFAIRHDRLVELAPQLSGIGYKILLDIMSSAPTPLKLSEHPYVFRARQHGESKLDSMVVLHYLEMLIEKRVGRWVPIKFIKFGIVGALGLIVHMTILSLLLKLNLGFGFAQVTAVFSAMTFNFLLNNSFTYRDRRLKGLRIFGGLLSFYIICGLGAVANVGVGEWLFENSYRWWLAGLAGAAVGSVWNYAMGSIFTWRKAN
ncbi:MULTISPECIES: glycosyltransferase [Sphingobium]|jgi:dolichol-phosphate mannosyltransferase|uniref:glycosyltransferase n=1 Tax=Sphingobium TaxID=165695 RepID=UPI000E708AD5|nr:MULTISPECIES: glycosyltransferase family 2 protein [Sphingobium]KAA9019062.1 glycosyltransferase family 2 protein [Sphingobium limneticum]MBU0932796.1 glycosyltransferase family 2 protein [Alphaproteobacteria bacterium]